MILDELAAHAMQRVEADKRKISEQDMKCKALNMPKDCFRFEKALKKPAFICEVKKASPSKGIISQDFPYIDIAKSYENAGANCISVLTEPKWFLGSDNIFEEIRAAVKLPMLRKDFTIDEYQIYQAKTMGADCVLLICALLDTNTLENYISICDTLGISALVETHDAKEIESAVEAGARLIGVNNRNLKDFTVNFDNVADMRAYIPQDAIFVAESGIKTAKDAGALFKTGADAVLCGEALMRSNDKAEMLADMRKAAQ